MRTDCHGAASCTSQPGALYDSKVTKRIWSGSQIPSQKREIECEDTKFGEASEHKEKNPMDI